MGVLAEELAFDFPVVEGSLYPTACKCCNFVEICGRDYRYIRGEAQSGVVAVAFPSTVE
jgi:hypothetical protein